MKKTATLSKKLKDYSILAGSILASSMSADGQVIYTDIPDQVLGGFIPSSFPSVLHQAIDLNNDGTFDFKFTINFVSSGFVSEIVDGDYNVSYNQIMIYRNSQYLPIALSQHCGDAIPQSGSFYGSHFANISFFLGSLAANQWLDVHDGIMAFKFKSADTHYAWLRLDVNTMGDTPVIVIKDYAYEATPSKPIIACDSGAVGISVINPSANDVSVFPNPSEGNCIIKFRSPMKSELNIRVTDALGKEVYATTTQISSAQNELPLDLSDLSQGIYFIEMKSDDFSLTEKWIRK